MSTSVVTESKMQTGSSDRTREQEELVALLRAGHPNAKAKIFDRYGEYVERLLIRVMGNGPDVEDLLHDVFMQTFISVHTLKDASRFKAWLTRLTVNTARSAIRKKSRSRWLVFLPHHEVPEVHADTASSEEVTVVVYRVLRKIRNADDRVAFTLRHLDGMTLQAVADATGCSLATVKRRVERGKQAFHTLAKTEPCIVDYLEER